MLSKLAWPPMTFEQENKWIDAYWSAIDDGLSEEHAEDVADASLSDEGDLDD